MGELIQMKAGKINIKEATELYENTQDLLKDYPTALNVRVT